jgi:glucose/arabinose dehydrogenase
MRSNLLLLLLALLVPGFARAAQSDAPLPQVPAGFGITVYAEVPRARQLAVGPPGVIFVGSRGDRVYALIDKNDDGYAESVRVVAQGLDTPAGIAWRDGDLYVAEVTRITRWRGQGRDAPEVTVPEILLDSLPAQRGHAMRPAALPEGLGLVTPPAPQRTG